MQNTPLSAERLLSLSLAGVAMGRALVDVVETFSEQDIPCREDELFSFIDRAGTKMKRGTFDSVLTAVIEAGRVQRNDDGQLVPGDLPVDGGIFQPEPHQ